MPRLQFAVLEHAEVALLSVLIGEAGITGIVDDILHTDLLAHKALVAHLLAIRKIGGVVSRIGRCALRGVAVIRGDEALPEAGIVDTVEDLHGILCGTDIAELAVAGDVADTAREVLIDRGEVEVHLIAIASPSSFVVGELCGEHHFIDFLVVAVGLLVVPQLLKVLAQRMCGDDLLAIFDHGVEIRALVTAVPVVVEFAGTEQMCLGQEMRCGALGDASRLCRFLRQQRVGFVKVVDDLLIAFLQAVAREHRLHARGGIELQGHAAKLLDEIEVGVGTKEIGLAEAYVVVDTALGVVLRDVVDKDVGRFHQAIHVVPHWLVGPRLGGVEGCAVGIPACHVVGTGGELVDAHVVAFDGPDIVELEFKFLVSAGDKLVKALLSLVVVSALLCDQILFEKLVTARGKPHHSPGEQGEGEDMLIDFHVDFVD